MASDTITTVKYNGTTESTGTTYGGSLPANVSQNNSYSNSFSVNTTPVRLVKHTFTCDTACSYNSAPTYSINALEPWRYYVLQNVLSTEPVYGRITSIEFEVWHQFTNTGIPASQGDVITFTSCPYTTPTKADTSSPHDHEDEEHGGSLLGIPPKLDPSSFAIYEAILSDPLEVDGGDFESRSILVKGEPGSTFTISIQRSDGKYYNFEGGFSEVASVYKSIIPRDRDMHGLIPGKDFKRGVYVREFNFPQPGDGDEYTIILNPDSATNVKPTTFISPDSPQQESYTSQSTLAAISPAKTIVKTKSSAPIFTITPRWTGSSGITLPANKEFSYLAANLEVEKSLSIKKDNKGVPVDIFLCGFTIVSSSNNMSIVKKEKI